MVSNSKVINDMTPAELAAVIRETGSTVYEITVIDGKPVIHAALRIVNAKTGENIPGGLPFSVVLFKRPGEKNYSNIAIGTVVPVTELDIRLPRDYFNFCNQRLRFVRVFPLDERSFVIQMDLILHNSTQEYVKFGFGLWGALFSQILYELIGRGRESLEAAAEIYANLNLTDLSASAVMTLSEMQMVGTLSSADASEVPSGSVVENTDVMEEGDAMTALACAEGPYSVLSGDHASEAEDNIPVLSEFVMMDAEPVEGKDYSDTYPAKQGADMEIV